MITGYALLGTFTLFLVIGVLELIKTIKKRSSSYIYPLGAIGATLLMISMVLDMMMETYWGR